MPWRCNTVKLVPAVVAPTSGVVSTRSTVSISFPPLEIDPTRLSTLMDKLPSAEQFAAPHSQSERLLSRPGSNSVRCPPPMAVTRSELVQLAAAH